MKKIFTFFVFLICFSTSAFSQAYHGHGNHSSEVSLYPLCYPADTGCRLTQQKTKKRRFFSLFHKYLNKNLTIISKYSLIIVKFKIKNNFILVNYLISTIFLVW